MSQTRDSTLVDPQQIIADLQRTNAELLQRLDASNSERDEALAQQTAAAEVLQVINSSRGDLAPVFDVILQKAHALCGAAHGVMVIREGEEFRPVAANGEPAFVDAFGSWVRFGHQRAVDRRPFWVAPNMEFFEYLPESRPTQPDIPFYARMDYGNRVGFWRMLDVLNKHKVRACCCLNLELLDHFPEVKDAMIAADWDYMAHGLYNSRPIYDYTEEQERAYWQDFVTHLKEMTGKRLKGRLGGGAGYTVRTDDLMAEAGCLYHTSWIMDDQPWPINVRGGQKFIYVPYTGQTNDAGMLAWNREADYFHQMIKDQFDTFYQEGAENGRVMCLSLHPHNIGRPNAAKHLDEALRYILGHDGVWATTADDIAEYYLANYYDQVKSWIAEHKAQG